MNIAICDDEQQDIDILYNYCKSCKLPYNISTFLSASALLEAFKFQLEIHNFTGVYRTS